MMRATQRRIALHSHWRAVFAIVAVSCFVAGNSLALRHPIAPVVAAMIFTLWCMVVAAWPRSCVFVLPAVLPVCDFASWTGWIVFEEFDLAVIGAIVGGYIALVAAEPRDEITPSSDANVGRLPALLLALFFTSLTWSLWRGVSGSLDSSPSLYGGYYSALNSLRIAKSFFLALLLLPIVKHEMRSEPNCVVKWFENGMTSGCVVASLLVLWERVAFPGVLDFSSDYRVTALFWEMHVGGAALDAFLALTVPIALLKFLRSRMHAAFGLPMLIVAYACLVTFSRGLYIGLFIAASIIVWLESRSKIANGAKSLLCHAIAILGICGVASYVVFREGGYRGLIASTGAMAVILGLAFTSERIAITRASGMAFLGLMFAVPLVFAGAQVKYGIYVVYGAIFAFAIVVGVLVKRSNACPNTKWMLAAAAAQGALIIAAVGVARAWGGADTWSATLISLCVFWLWIMFMSHKKVPFSLDTRLQNVMVWAIIAVAASTAAVAGGSYIGVRLGAAKQDLQSRIAHWDSVAGMLTTGAAWLLGNGLGRYPLDYFYNVRDGRFPGGYRLDEDHGTPVLLLAGPRHPTGFGELFRVSQRVSIEDHSSYSVVLELRAVRDVHVHVEICEKHLLYSARCAVAIIAVKATGSAWKRNVATLNGQLLTRGEWYAPRLGFFSIAVDSIGERIELKHAEVFDSDGRNLIVNSDFSQGLARWFFTSDRDHLPWHTKNLALDVVFGQGLVAIVILAMLIAYALSKLIAASRRNEDAIGFAAGLVAFLTVGVFDALLDVPRVTFLFYLTMLIGLLFKSHERSNARSVGLLHPPDDL
jgi:hypothetical protein